MLSLCCDMIGSESTELSFQFFLVQNSVKCPPWTHAFWKVVGLSHSKVQGSNQDHCVWWITLILTLSCSLYTSVTAAEMVSLVVIKQLAHLFSLGPSCGAWGVDADLIQKGARRCHAVVLCFYRGVTVAHMYMFMCICVYLCKYAKLHTCAQISGRWEATRTS